MQPFVEEKLIPERDSHEDVIQREKEFITAHNDDDDDDGEEDIDDDDDDEEFSFVSVGGEIADTSLISADEAFVNGQIKPVFPVFNKELLSEFEHMTLHEGSTLPVKKIFVQTKEDRATSSSESDIVSGPYCDLSSRNLVEVSSPSSESCNCKKSNSTGFSKIWRFNKDCVGRSNSDGRDAFVFLSESHAPPMKKTDHKGVVEKSTGKSVRANKTASYSAHEAYLRSKVKEDKRKRSSYLPYRPELMGFFTNVNSGLTKNVHPF